MNSPVLNLEALNALPEADYCRHLDGLYEHSPWVVARSAVHRPFASLAALKYRLARIVREATSDEQLALICAHPELASRAAVAGELTDDSKREQGRAGLLHCSPEEFEQLRTLNAQYRNKFGFPFIIAVRGPTGDGLTRQEIIAALARRVRYRPATERAEALRQIDRIAEIRLKDRVHSDDPTHLDGIGVEILRHADALAAHTEVEGQLSCTFMSPAHRATAAQLAHWMNEAGFDEVRIDAVGNVIGRYRRADPNSPPRCVATGSHYDTVRNGGKHDGRLGVLLPIALVRRWHAQQWRAPFDLEVIGFSEEEGVRFGSTFLGSQAWLGRFDPAWLELKDANGITLREALQQAGHDPQDISAMRAPADLTAFLEVHIEQGPVLLERDLPLGVVTSIAGSSRERVRIQGTASHSGTTPMNMRHDAACAAAELTLAVESRCRDHGSLVGTVGQLQVPQGSVNVIPGRCELSLDVRAGDDATRDAAMQDIGTAIERIAAERSVVIEREPLLRAAAAPCDATLQQALSNALEALGLPAHALPSGAGHDAMVIAPVVPTAMLFTRCGNGGISHNPLETMTADDAQLAARVMDQVLRALS